MLGVLDITDVPFEKNGGIWDYVGYKMVGDLPLEGEIDTRVPLDDGNGNKYIHVNVLTPINVKDVAEALAVSTPEIAIALSKIPEYFITDAEGNAKLPEVPLRIFL